jgi:hypothetical protein
MQRSSIVKIGMALFVVISLAACTFEVRLVSTPTPDIFSTGVPTPLRETPSSAASPEGIATVVPQPTPEPLPIFASGGPVEMDSGSTDASMDGSVPKDGRVNYLVGAKAGQFMIVKLTSAHPSLHLEIQSPDGRLLAQAASNLTAWQGVLPAAGDYRISVVAQGGPENFNLNIVIPVQVKFDPGAVSAELKGQVGAHRVNTYLLRALKDQNMMAVVNTPKNDVFLTIYGIEDGQLLVRSEAGATHAVVKLPATQDYMIDLVSAGDTPENYTVTFFVK